MKFEDLFPYSFKSLRRDYGIPEPSKVGLIESCRSNDSDLCREMVAAPFCLTERQMLHAAERYLLGKSRCGKTIYWMIDRDDRCLDGHIGNGSYTADTWVSTLLINRFPKHFQFPPIRHCLFGLHLLQEKGEKVAIVESERSAVILSELFPDFTWLASVYPMNLSPDNLEPLQGHEVTLFPRTDTTMTTYLSWQDTADLARRRCHLDITVDDTLEKHASDGQKERGFDLLDFICDRLYDCDS